jgi:cytochrome c-type biogenesis protein
MNVMFIVLGIGIPAFGLGLMSPGLGAVFTRLTNGLAARADAQLDEVDRSRLSGQFIGRSLLGMVWSPCIGPTLGVAIALTSGGGSLL